VIVLDAAALVDVVLDQPAKPWVLEHLESSPIVASAHQLAEVLSALARLVRAGTITHAVAADALAEAKGRQQDVVVPTSSHLARALDLQERVHVLNALYVVLAQDQDASSSRPTSVSLGSRWRSRSGRPDRAPGRSGSYLWRAEALVRLSAVRRLWTAADRGTPGP
jgi:predicted nucleic acid-binding protein